MDRRLNSRGAYDRSFGLSFLVSNSQGVEGVRPAEVIFLGGLSIFINVIIKIWKTVFPQRIITATR